MTEAMTEAKVMTLVYLAAILLYGSDRVGDRSRLPWLTPRLRNRAARVLSCALSLLAYLLWTDLEAGPAAPLVTTLAWMALGPLPALLHPRFPRVFTLSVVLSSLALPGLALLGGLP